MAVTRKVRFSKKTGKTPLGYVGINSVAPPSIITVDRVPRDKTIGLVQADYKQFDQGALWVDTDNQDIYYLAKKLKKESTWIKLNESLDNLTKFNCDVGSATPVLVSGIVNVTGGTHISTSGIGNNLSITLGNGLDGEMLISGGVEPIWANITSIGGSIVVTNGPNTINIESIVPDAFDTLTGDNAVAAVPVAGKIDVLGGLNINTSGAADIASVYLDNSPIIPGTLTLSTLGVGVAQTSAAGLVSSSNGANGQVLIGGGAAPTWDNITSTGATITITNGAGTINIETATAPGLSTLTADDANTATPVLGKIYIVGGANINTSASTDTLTIDLNNSIDIPGTFTLSALGVGVAQTSAAGLVSSSNGANGEILIGGGTAPAWDNITSTGATITITNGAGTINIEAVAATGLSTLTADDTNTASPVSGEINIAGSANITTVATGDTLTINLDDAIDIPGTFTLSALGAGVMTTNATGLSTSSNGANGEILVGGGTAPSWTTITAGTNISVTNGVNTIVIDTTTSSPSGSESFLAHQATTVSAGGSGVVYYLGEDSILTEIFDTGANFYPGDGLGAHATYTVPVDGKYYLNYNHIATPYAPPPPPPPVGVDPPAEVVISTTNFDFIHFTKTLMIEDGICAPYTSITCDLAMGDTVEYWSDIVYERVGIRGHATELYTFVSGYLVAAN